ncbi:hypothetical protein Slin_1965 [Spirosoma linguale DSM 74]|uniref:Abortive infection protein-like C-terminal domain-containing protein n=2 Tax=Spirosoma TaxID=107 RepID=D2QCK5_SPILD|nr:hypothetical protein Slin_1965 [Spirosoma linguale DSM 74]
MLRFDTNLRYYSSEEVTMEFQNEISEMISKMARGKQSVLEHFKTYFASAAGTTSSWSTSISWADTDLRRFMTEASKNAVLFIEAFYDACESLIEEEPGTAVPDYNIINWVLSKHSLAYQIKPPELLILSGKKKLELTDILPISIDQSAKDKIHQSLAEANRLLSEGRDKQAVQEILWLLESITTVYRGITNENNSTIQGKYFNKIIGEIRRHNKGNATDQIIIWIENLHGYLSAPAGGGIRHGLDLKEGILMTRHEAVLYCSLTTSYINFLLAEYDRLAGKSTISVK